MATPLEVARLRLALGDTALTNEQLSDIIDATDDMAEATTLAWTAIAAGSVQMVNVSEAGSSRSLGDVFNNSLKMAEFARKVQADEDIPVVTTRPTVVRRIERE